jgi:hypothetical protein
LLSEGAEGVIVTQIGIALCGVTAVWLSQDPREKWRRWSSVFGLAGQPFWFAETLAAEQWGMLVLCALYTWSWWRGFRAHWLKRSAA